MERDYTTVRVKKSTWEKLNAEKKCGEMMEDVIDRLYFKNKGERNE